TPVFINAGDGKHEHPTQEFLDEFSFLERTEWNTDSIHIALVGDLAHGRTIHSKADGQRIFKDVHVDLIAPKEIALPEYYMEKMIRNGFTVRTFSSIEEYLEGNERALIWYFTRLQLERMGEDVRERVVTLRKSVTFAKEFLPRISPDTRFYHPLPRHRVYPTIPYFLDELPLNAWDEQSINGYYTRIIELALFNGLFGDDFTGNVKTSPSYADDFVQEVSVRKTKVHEYKVGIKPVDNGIVIDHIGRGQPIESIWKHIDKIRRIMKLNYRSSHGVYHSNTEGMYKGIISLPDILSFDESQIKMLGAIAPGCTLNIIKDRNVLKKYRLLMPPRVYGFEEISCKNENCISYPEHAEHVTPEFFRSEKSTFVCKYCEKPHSFHEIWDT
ncbi:MAG TPA: aspartate carbamoyltransferase regulatory subunit, partial [Spirochaetia bacterium]|nr:aspartate carbamoyltransferase regulatory subunit [Spirochaetia bacterium]